MYLHYSAISDVGRVRRENQDSGYAGPWLLTVCDGVGGAVRGDLASSTAVQALRKLDREPDDDVVGQVAGALHRADDRIAELVEEDPALNGTSTTATVALFDGTRFAIGHIGDSRAYLQRRGQLRQLTHDHTFVQSLIDEGRITEEQSRTHPHRNLILKALDGIRHEEPDLFEFPAEPGDRVLVCSDGACGTLTDDRIADILASGTPDYAAVELVRASLEAGSTDNVTCVVAEVSEQPPAEDLAPLLVGAAADLPRRTPLSGAAGAVGGLFRGHRSGDTGEIPPVPGDVPEGAFAADPIDHETARYAPRPPRRFAWLRRLLVLAVVLGVAWVVLAAGWSWSQQQFYVAEQDGKVAIFRGIDASLPGVSLSHPYETTDVDLDRLSDIDAEQVREGIEADSLDDARLTVDNYAARQDVG
ncbi:PP2C family protein-serine/threonine phosphatase [Nocardioides okcheonensis]|uniref:PP2C family protein-serine/threonine phosphatase n=1 Tax=Nocardioides okcheonensis TaxID=2894081 RepID=UPI001E348AE7|nr:protein phosphatase 2C domain-containing protein [Nocardioides okcheonensis]UFN43025.1 protein phosphatase 2C domain-containing protein [Nocardioides okcheonensis]